MDKTGYLLMVCLGVGALSWLLRALPFLLFGRRGEPPKTVAYIGRVLSPAAIAMLLVYCYAGYVPQDVLGGQLPPALVSGVLVAVLQVVGRNPLLSIISGTVLYMVLLRLA